MKFFQRFSKKQQTSYGLVAAVLVFLSVALMLTNNEFRANTNTPTQIINTASLTYKNSQNEDVTINSNTVATSISQASLPTPIISSLKASTGCGQIAKIAWSQPASSYTISKFIIYKDNIKIAENPPTKPGLTDHFLLFQDSHVFNEGSVFSGQHSYVYAVVAVGSNGLESSPATKTLEINNSSFCKDSNLPTAATISNITATKNSDTEYVINWQTNISATSQVAHGETKNLGYLSALGAGTQSHSATISLASALAANSHYYFNISALTTPMNLIANISFSGIMKFDNTGQVSKDSPLVIQDKTIAPDSTSQLPQSPDTESTQDTPASQPANLPEPTDNTTNTVATDTDPKTTITGTVIDNGTPVPGAEVEIYDNSKKIASTTTDSAGNYTATSTESNENIDQNKQYDIKVSKGVDYTQDIKATPDQAKTITIKKNNWVTRVWLNIVSFFRNLF